MWVTVWIGQGLEHDVRRRRLVTPPTADLDHARRVATVASAIYRIARTVAVISVVVSDQRPTFSQTSAVASPRLACRSQQPGWVNR
jgi:hypothetical protein